MFAYGTLMVPAILLRVLGRKGEDLKFQDAVLHVCGVAFGADGRATRATTSRTPTTRA